MAGTISSSTRRPIPSPLRSSLKRNSDFFRPSLPSDPFSSIALPERGPVVLNLQRLYHAVSASHPRRDVILVLGDPSPEDLAPLFNSERLAFSLLIIASHRPPLIPPKVQPAVRLLRLAEPLALGHAGAIRFVNILEWAERVARVWRKVGDPGVRELTECDQDRYVALSPPQSLLRLRSKSNPPSPAPSVLLPDSSASSTSTHTNSAFDKLRSLGKRRSSPKLVLPPPDSSQRPFDALINYLPPDMSDKSLLKFTILVTALSRSFLVGVGSPPSVRRPVSHRSSIFKPKLIYSTPSTPLGSQDSLNNLITSSPFSRESPIKAHLVHLLHPRPRNSVTDRVLQNIETFLLSFSFPPTLETKGASTIEPARACLLESATFGEPVAVPSSLNINWTIADVLLSGCLDEEAMPRAWFSGAEDIVIAALPPSQPYLSPLAALHLGINTPPDSEEDASCRHALPVKKPQDERTSRWKFWKRRATAATQR
ncbi:hypothetical protein BJV74DRAFT_887941 [Russula compacta]|nr:hypothetical protein BJV74DRAFT_887941 [Russula compacta]